MNSGHIFFISLACLEKEATFASPENFYLFPVFDNPLFKNGRRTLKGTAFDNIEQKIEQVSNLFKSESEFYTLNELNLRYDTVLTQHKLDVLHAAIRAGLASLNINLSKCTWHQEPRQSLIIQIASRNLKGCRGFYNTFRARANYRTDTTKFENKWHEKLGCVLSVPFWDKCWKLHASTKYNNQFKWLQCQILRGSLYTNHRVAKFKANVLDTCDFCGLHSEQPLALFVTCQCSHQFWGEVCDYFLNFGILIPMSRLKVLFGVLDQPYDSTVNTVIMIGKQAIWACKQRKSIPNLTYFKNSLKDYLIVLKYCSNMNNTCLVFNDQWAVVLSSLTARQDGP